MAKGIHIELADGKEYLFRPLTLGDLEDTREDLRRFEDPSNQIDAEAMAIIAGLAHRSLRRSYPDLTLTDVKNLLGIDTLLDVFEAVMDIAGLKRKQVEEGKRLALANQATSTGDGSTLS